jgi:sortase B
MNNRSLLSKILIIFGIIISLGGVLLLVINMGNDEVSIITDNTHSDFKDNKNEYNVNIKMLKLEKNNNEIFGVLRVDEVELYSILTKTNDNDYYLNHNIKGKKTESGNPFVDYRNKSIDDKEIIIYGNINNDEFNKLSKLFNRDTFNKNIKIELYLESGKATYELKMVKITDINYKDQELITDNIETITTYDDNEIHTIEVDKEEIDEEGNEIIEPVGIYESIYNNSKYCKDDCKLSNSDSIIVIELINNSSVTSNMVIIGNKINE